MYQYTTPTITIKIPQDVSVQTIDSLAVVIQQDDIKLTKNLLGCILDPDDNTITITLSQEETGGFKPGTINVQAHILVGNTAYATQIMKANIFRNIHGEVIV